MSNEEELIKAATLAKENVRRTGYFLDTKKMPNYREDLYINGESVFTGLLREDMDYEYDKALYEYSCNLLGIDSSFDPKKKWPDQLKEDFNKRNE